MHIGIVRLTNDYDPATRAFWLENAIESARSTTQQAQIASTEWIMNHSGLPWLQLQVQLPYQEMALEALRLLDKFVEHRGGIGRGWRSLCIRGIDEEKTRSPRHYGYSEESAPYTWTSVADECPVTTAFFREDFPLGRLFRVRFMLLEPGGYIAPHRDTETNFLSAINIAITNPHGSFFKMKNKGLVPFEAGRAFLLDVGNEHSCVNLSEEPRIHIIVHGDTPTAQWDGLLANSLAATQLPS